MNHFQSLIKWTLLDNSINMKGLVSVHLLSFTHYVDVIGCCCLPLANGDLIIACVCVCERHSTELVSAQTNTYCLS